MGIILSRFRKKQTRIEILEKLESDIKSIEKDRSYAEKQLKRITKYLFVYSTALYILCGILFYIPFTSTLKEKLLFLMPLALTPLVLYFINKIISWYYVRMLSQNQSRLNEMKKEKQKLLNEVMDNETYKVAKEILEKFSENVPKPYPTMQLATLSAADKDLRRRVPNTTNASTPQTSRNVANFAINQVNRHVNKSSPSPRALPAYPRMSLPAPVLPLDRGYIDRVFEYLIGDGPNNRYALICSQCHSHNGMALKEEFEYIGFKCCYCFFYNPARKLRPEAPKLESLLKESPESDSDSDIKISWENSAEEDKSDMDNDQGLTEENAKKNNTLSGSPLLETEEEPAAQDSEIGAKVPKELGTDKKHTTNNTRD